MNSEIHPHGIHEFANSDEEGGGDICEMGTKVSQLSLFAYWLHPPFYCDKLRFYGKVARSSFFYFVGERAEKVASVGERRLFDTGGGSALSRVFSVR